MADELKGTEVGTAYVTVLPDARDFHKKLADQTGQASGAAGQQAGGMFATGFGKALPLVGGAVAGLFAADKIKQFASESIDAASDLAESQSKVQVVFGDGAAAVEKWAETSSTSVLLSKQAALEAAGTYGNLFTAMGITQQRASSLSREAVQMAADLASFNNRDVGDVLEKIRSGLVGETEPLRDLGINLNQARIQQEALNQHLWDGKGRIDAAAQAQAAWSLILKDGKNAIGDVDRTSAGYANTTRAVAAAVENAKASIGQGLVMAANDASKAFGGPGGLTSTIEAWGQRAGNTIVGVEVGLRNAVDLAERFNSALGSSGDQMNIVDVLKSFPGANVAQPVWDWLNNYGQQQIDEQKAAADAVAARHETARGEMSRYVSGLYDAQQASAGYSASLRGVGDDAAATATGISTLKAALDEFDARSKARTAGAGIRDQWRSLEGMGETVTEKYKVRNPKWRHGSLADQYLTKTRQVQQAFDPDVDGGRFAFTETGDAARQWAVGLGKQVSDRAQEFNDPARSEAFINRWIKRLGGQFKEWDVEKPYAYARSFFLDTQPYSNLAAPLPRPASDRSPMDGGPKYEFHDTTIYTTPGEDVVTKAEQVAHAAKGSRVPVPPWQR